MTGNRNSSSTRQASKEIPQFAPNFTVYVLPPDVVCLYSEDRKFFLHGELMNHNWPMIISYVPSFILLAVMIILIIKYRK